MIERIGRYEILERVATGGQGTVYRARDPNLDRIVAIKVINQSVAYDPQYLEALQQEARLAGALNHPNIIRIYDFQVENDIAYIVMEYIPDGLDKRIKRNGPIDWRRAIDIVIQASQGLSYAHDAGVVHRDIKPPNLLIGDDNNVKVTDFGIARALALSTRSSTSVMGTPHYMAPEQWESGGRDPRSDQYALGAVLYELLLGNPPFQSDSIGAIYVQHREASVPDIPDALNIPQSVKHVIDKAMAKAPDDRFRNMSEMIIAMEEVLNGRDVPVAGREAIVSPSIGRVPPSGVGSSRVTRANLAKTWVVLACVGALAGSFVVIAVVFPPIFIGNGDPKRLSISESISDRVPTVQLPALVPTQRPTTVPTPLSTIPTLDIKATIAVQEIDRIYQQARSLFNESDFVEAINQYNRLIVLDTSNITYYQDRGSAYYSLGHYDNALNDINKAIQLDPMIGSNYGNRGLTNYRLGEYDQAIKDYTKASELDSDDVFVYGNRGLVYYQVGDYNQAIRDYSKAIELDPMIGSNYGNRGLTHYRLKDYEQAIRDYSKAIELDLTDSVNYGNRGLAFYELGDYGEAIQDYTKAIELDPTYVFNYGNRGLSYFELGNYAQAIRDYDKAIELDPTVNAVYLLRDQASSSMEATQPTPTPMPTRSTRPTPTVYSPTPTTVYARNCTEKEKGAPFSLYGRMSGTKGVTLSAWVEGVMLAEVNNVRTNYTLNVPVCDPYGISVIGRMLVMKIDGKVRGYPVLIQSGIAHKLDF